MRNFKWCIIYTEDGLPWWHIIRNEEIKET